MGVAFGGWWIAHKGALVASTGLSRDLLHFAIGGVAFVLLCAGLRSRGGAWAALLMIELANELADATAALSFSWDIAWADSAGDIALTMLVPTVIWSWLAMLATWFPAASRRPASGRRRAGRRRATATARPISTGPISTGPISTGPISTGPISTRDLSTVPVTGLRA